MTNPKRLTDAELAEIEGRLEKITPGEYRVEVEGDENGGYAVVRQVERGVIPFGCKPDGTPDIADATFYAHAPTDIRRLLEEVKRSREEDKLKKQPDSLKSTEGN